ncbi:MAG: phosphate signaling complex protein PhoU [Opitutaceae bacterium]|nr:phosphate signaling complex protein PhoU [Opitutaceae bacterium]
MKRFFDKEMESFRSHLVLMGATASDQVRHAIQSLVEGDTELARRVIATDDKLDQLEIKIDEEAVRYMSLRSPVASELRLVIVGMKASHDLERVGDEATNIAKRVLKLVAEPPLKPYVDIPRMSVMATGMLRDALDCFLNADADKAAAVIRRDAEVDDLNKQLYRELTSFMVEKPDTISRAIDLMFISKSLERIADHATNIAEEMIYLARGKDVRHDGALKGTPASPPANG